MVHDTTYLATRTGSFNRSLWRLQVGPLAKCRRANETVTAYLEHFQLFVTGNAIEDDKLVPTLLTVVGSAHYTLLRGLVAPKMPTDLTFDQLKETLTKHFDPEPILIAERFRFTSATRAPVRLLATTWLVYDASQVRASSEIFTKTPFAIASYAAW